MNPVQCDPGLTNQLYILHRKNYNENQNTLKQEDDFKTITMTLVVQFTLDTEIVQCKQSCFTEEVIY